MTDEDNSASAPMMSRRAREAEKSASESKPLDNVMYRITSLLKHVVDPAVEFELAALAKAAPEIVKSGNVGNLQLMGAAISALEGPVPNIIFSQELRQKLSTELEKNSKSSPYGKLGIGLLIGCCSAGLFGLLVYVASQTILALLPNPTEFLWLGLSASFGAAVRLILRFGKLEFRRIPEVSPYFSGISGRFWGFARPCSCTRCLKQSSSSLAAWILPGQTRFTQQ